MKKTRMLYLPYVIAITGIILSFMLWYARQGRPALASGSPDDLWIDLILSISLSLLISALVAMLQMIQRRAAAIEKINASLKKEIKQREAMERTKQKLEDALQQGQKLQAIGTLAGGIAHDFNNILYAIIGYAELARADVPDDSLVHKNLGKVLDGAHRGQELISRILAFSRRQHKEYSMVSLTQVIESALSLLRPTIPASVIINYKHRTDPAVNGNQNQLHQVIMNLINNAVDAMDGEGTITITVSELGPTDDILSQLPDNIQQPYCKLEVKDTGHGMDQATQARIFEPFFTTKEVGKGTGLGLSIVHSILEEHGGRITVNSQLGHGTTFTILLPIQTSEAGR